MNSVYYRQAGGGSVSTISRAVLVLGFDAVRNIAITVMLFEHLQNKTNASHLKEEFLRANLAGILAKEIGERTSARDVEELLLEVAGIGLVLQMLMPATSRRSSSAPIWPEFSPRRSVREPRPATWSRSSSARCSTIWDAC